MRKDPPWGQNICRDCPPWWGQAEGVGVPEVGSDDSEWQLSGILP
jgi:hypothetical protein